MAWDPQLYLSFGAERTRPAAELLGRVALDAPARVVDLGCGPGNSTALLVARWPQAEVEGVDSSPEMLEEARAAGISARWTCADITSWKSSSRCDVIYSNATFQWLPDHARLLPRLASYLPPNGVLAFQVPSNFGELSHTLIHETVADGPWAGRLADARMGDVLEGERYFDILEPHVSQIDIWEARYIQVLSGDDAVYRWMMGTGLRPFANALEGDEREAFLAEYRRRVGLAYPMRKSGITLYPFQRLFCVARR
ncbi:MAG TPA: methyltransferase domain-containing protein [Rhizomicrobium sp.]